MTPRSADALFGPPWSTEDPISDVAAEAVTVRVPAGEGDAPPRMGVPILLRGRAAGGCYLGVPRAADDFGDADLALLQIAVQGVATVIEKSRTAAANRQREAWYDQGVAVAREIVTGASDPLRLVAERASTVAAASVAAVLERAGDDPRLQVTLAVGTAADQLVGRTLPLDGSVTASVLSSGRPAVVTDMRQTVISRVWVHRLGIESALILPLTGGGAQRYVLVLGRGADAPRFSQAEMGMAAMFAGTVALALELSQSQILRNQVALVAERDRIARDLHDHVIQRLYAIGLTMQSVIATTPEAEGERLLRSLDDIDETIKQIRATIFRLTTPILSASASSAQSCRGARRGTPARARVPAGARVHRPGRLQRRPRDRRRLRRRPARGGHQRRTARRGQRRRDRGAGHRRGHPPAHRRQRARAGRVDPSQRHRESSGTGRGARRLHAGAYGTGGGHVAALVRAAAYDGLTVSRATVGA